MSPEFGQQLLIACALVLVFEGIFPSLAPKLWRDAFSQLTQMTDSQLRTIGLISMFSGLALLFWLNT